MLLSMFPDVAAVSPFALADVAGDVETTVTAPCAAPSKAFGTRVNANRHGAVGGISVCAHKPYNLLHHLFGHMTGLVTSHLLGRIPGHMMSHVTDHVIGFMAVARWLMRHVT